MGNKDDVTGDLCGSPITRTAGMTTLDRSSSASWTLPVAVITLLTVFIGFQPIPFDPDLWFHLAGGQYILEEGHVPHADPFSFTKNGQLWVPHSWLFDIVTYALWTGIGPRATEAVFACIFAVTMLISLAVMSRFGVRPIIATGICAAIAIGAANTRGIRPQVLSLLLCNIVILLCIDHVKRPSRRILYLCPPLFLLWAQVHGACVMGVAVLGLWSIGQTIDAWRSKALDTKKTDLLILAGAAVGAAATILITPHRISHYQYALLTMGLTCLKETTEWQAPQLLPLAVPDIYYYLLLAGVIAAQVRVQKMPSMAALGLCAALLVLGFTGVRHIPLACIAAVPLLSERLGRTNHETAKTKRDSVFGPVASVFRSSRFRLGTGIACAICISLAWRFPDAIDKRYEAAEPVIGARVLATLGTGRNVFTTYNTGSYVLWSAPQRLRVMVDSRADVYGDAVVYEAMRAQSGDGWEELFKRNNISAVVVQNGDRLAKILNDDERWITVAEDKSARTFVRVASVSLAVGESCETSPDETNRDRANPNRNSG